MKSIHKPVLLKQSIKFLNIKPGGIYMDLTLGGGGHSNEIISKLKAQDSKLVSKVIAFDVDPKAIEGFRKYLIEKSWKEKDSTFTKDSVKVILVNENFSKLSEVLQDLKIKSVDGTVADLGVSSDQLEDASYGITYSKDGPLDMRLDPKLKVKASDIVNGLYEKELIKLFRMSDERYAKQIAKAIINERKVRSIKTTLHLVKIIKKALPLSDKGKQIARKAHVGPFWQKPVMRVFQSLRIAVNSELSSLQHLLPQVIEALATGSTFSIISFHSGEDRIIKKFFRDRAEKKEIRILTKKPVRPSMEEIENNPRARSAKLRAIEKL